MNGESLFLATTYVKLQQAYFSESNKAGGWQLIGYMAPGTNSSTTNFDYHPGAIAVGTSATLTASGNTIGWKAHNRVKLNECPLTDGSYPWTVTMNLGSTGASGSGQEDIVFTAAASGTGCIALTPAFDKIGK